jgi:hypothetical protein
MASDVSVLELAPAGTSAAIGFNMRGLLDSPMAKEMASSAPKLPLGLSAGLPGAPKLEGFDPTKDLDRLLAFVKMEGDKSSTLLVLSGRFDVEKMSAGAAKYHDVPMLESSKGEVLALLDAETAIFGAPADVQAAIDRRGAETLLAPDLAARIEEARQKYDIWGVGDCPQGLSMPGEAAGMFRSIDRFAFGASMRNGLELTADIHAKSPEDAGKLAAAAAIIEAAVKSASKDDGTKFEAHSEDGTFHIAVSIPEETLKSKHSVLADVISPEMKGEGAPTAPRPVETVPAIPAPPTVETVPATMPPAVEATAAAAPPAADSAMATAPPAVPDPPAPPATLESPGQAPVPPPAASAEPETAPAPRAPATPKPVAVTKLPNKSEVVKAPNGDTMILKLPGAK